MPPSHGRLARRLVVLGALTLLVLALGASAAPAQTGGDGAQADRRTVDILPVEGFLDPPVAGAITDVITSAAARDSELVVLQIDSPGAVSADVGAVVETMRSSPVPVAVFVGPLGTGARAAGGAAGLWLAADVRAAADDATVGPLEPFDISDPNAPIRSQPDLADDARRLLRERLGAGALEDAGLSGLTVAGLEPLLVELDGRTVSTGDGETTLRIRSNEVGVRFHSLGLVRRMLHAATTAPFVYLLLTVGLALLAFELFQPGFGVAGIAGVVMGAIGVFGLTVLPVVGWAVALLLLGLVLFTVDAAIAGFGPVTVAATAAFGAGSWWLYDAPVLALSPWLVAATTLAALVFFVFVLTVVLRAQAGPEGVEVAELVGKVGVVRSVLNPEGHVYIDGALWRARWTGGARRAKVGTPVAVHAVEGPLLLVDAFEPGRASEAHSGAGVGDR